MTSTAVSAQRTQFYIEGTPATANAVTAITQAAQAVVTIDGTHAVGEVIEFGNIAGMPEIFGLLGIIKAVGSGTVTVSIDSTGFAAPGTTGPASTRTWIKVGNIHDFNGFDGTASEIDVTNLDSTAMEYRPGLQDFGQFTFNIDPAPADPGHLALLAAKASQAVKSFKLTYPNAAIRAFHGFVKKFPETGGVNAVVKGSVDIRVTGSVSYS